MNSNASSEMPPKDSKTIGRYKCPSEMILDWKQSYLTSWAYLLQAKVKVWEDDRTKYTSAELDKCTQSQQLALLIPAVKLGMKMSAGRSEEKGIRKGFSFTGA